MNIRCVTRKVHTISLIIFILIFRNQAEGYANDNIVKRGINQETLDRVFRIADQIGRYSETVPNLFRVVKRELLDLEREVKLSALLPSKNKIEAFRLISEPFNRFLREGPKEYYIHNPPRGTAYNVQLNHAKEAIKGVYREIQTLWLSDIR